MQLILSALVALASLPSFGSAQSIDPKSVDKPTRLFWCQTQITQCPLLCLQLPGNSAGTRQNSCDADSLSYACVCSSGATPNVTEFSQTIPYFLCTESNNQCVKNCGGASACQDACRSSRPCGAQDPKRVNTTATSTMSATGTNGAARTGTDGAVVYTGLGGAAATTAASGGSGGGRPNAGNAMVDVGQSFGLALIVGSFLAGFALVM
ncbi:MAG: hypothetical protein M1814_001567 [Vezdaea aestivalis]|nr:MAG: hypothetical protein M1814_001567 [Vezdaea aestivalis]